jgi:hypothetical protein
MVFEVFLLSIHINSAAIPSTLAPSPACRRYVRPSLSLPLLRRLLFPSPIHSRQAHSPPLMACPETPTDGRAPALLPDPRQALATQPPARIPAAAPCPNSSRPRPRGRAIRPPDHAAPAAPLHTSGSPSRPRAASTPATPTRPSRQPDADRRPRPSPAPNATPHRPPSVR